MSISLVNYSTCIYILYTCLFIHLFIQELDNEPELCLLLNICDLLATSTEGECRFAEEVSRKFFSLEEMIK